MTSDKNVWKQSKIVFRESRAHLPFRRRSIVMFSRGKKKKNIMEKLKERVLAFLFSFAFSTGRPSQRDLDDNAFPGRDFSSSSSSHHRGIRLSSPRRLAATAALE